MKIILFAGPSLPANVARELLPEVEIRPPASCGDIYLASLERPAALALVDGYFDQQLSVWHKEILWALQRGIHVYGSSSMGALRAAELAIFGMQGVGWVFEQFRSGYLEDDDEVALVHESAREGYRTRSEAMVNLRATLQHAVAAGMLAEAARLRLVSELKRLFYPLRTRSALRALCAEALSPSEFERFDSWLEQAGIIDQKQLDARALLLRIGADRAAGVVERPFPRAERPFQVTNAWQALLESVRRPASDGAAEASLERSLESLQARFPDRHAQLSRQALARALALALAQARGVTAEAAAIQRASEEFRRQRGLLDPEQTARWLALAGLDLVGFSALMQGEVLEQTLAAELRRAFSKQLADVLRVQQADTALLGADPGDDPFGSHTPRTR